MFDLVQKWFCLVQKRRLFGEIYKNNVYSLIQCSLIYYLVINIGCNGM